MGARETVDGTLEGLPAFPVGFHAFNRHPHLNFELNRCFNSLGQESYKELMAAGQKITNFTTWQAEMGALATAAEAANEWYRASMYYRFTEFFMDPADPGKPHMYERFITLFNKALPHLAQARFKVPYAGGFLPGWHLKPEGAVRGTIVVHGGFDSFLEEIYTYLAYVQGAGFEIYAFEGPGQGAALKEHHLPMTHEWEKPVKAILDHFNLRDVTLMGISLGGYLASRAAAFEPRIKRLIAFDVMYDFFEAAARTQPAFFRTALRFLLRIQAKGLVNFLTRRSMQRDFLANWGVTHGMYVCGVDTPFDFFAAITKMSLKGVAEHITQDTLILAGESDHMVPLWMLDQQKRAMTSAKSVTTRIFTDAEHAGSHCQIGNPKLVLDYIISLQP